MKSEEFLLDNNPNQQGLILISSTRKAVATISILVV